MDTTAPATLLLDADPVAAGRLRATVGDRVVSTAVDVDQALRRLREGGIDLVVIGGPSRSDRAVLRRLQSADRDAAIVVLVAQGEAGLVLDPQDVGIRSTIDVGGLDDTSLRLSLQLAVERHRLALAQVEAARQAEELARVRPSRDPLTGLPSGESLLAEVDRFLADAIRFTRAFSVGLVQIDGLQACRIREGSAVADSMVIHVAGVMGECLRTSDLLGRLDDDQMLIAMPGTDVGSAHMAVDRISQQLRATPCRIGHRDRQISATVGLASLFGLMSVDELVYRADTALREAQGALHQRL